MAPCNWNPGRCLQITDSGKNNAIFCLGRAKRRFNSRCQWELSNDYDYTSNTQAVREMLQRMASGPPTQVSTSQLESLARVCVCDHHKDQHRQIVSELEDRLNDMKLPYKLYEQERNRNQNTQRHGSSSSGRGFGGRQSADEMQHLQAGLGGLDLGRSGSRQSNERY